MVCLRIFVTEDFHDFMKASKLSEKDVVKSANELANGLYDADLSGNVFKKQLPHQADRSQVLGVRLLPFALKRKSSSWPDGRRKMSISPGQKYHREH